MKLQMFGELGELAIFRRTGLRPVFFGDNVIGDRLPSFTYMLTFDDMAAREKNWARSSATASGSRSGRSRATPTRRLCRTSPRSS